MIAGRMRAFIKINPYRLLVISPRTATPYRKCEYVDWLPTDITWRSGDTYLQKEKDVKKSVYSLESFIVFQGLKTLIHRAMNKVP